MWLSSNRIGRHALITGASGGIGRAIAVRLAREGVDPILVARRERELEKTADLVRSAGAGPQVVAGDIGDPAVRDRALASATSRFGGLDLLVNNAGVSAHGRFHESSPERLRKMLDLNVIAAAELIRSAAPMLSESDSACVVNVGSILGWRGVPFNAEYCASKFALRGLSEAIRPELAGLGISVLHASPGTVDTEFFDHLIDKSGDPPWGQRRGVPAERVADRIVRGIAQRKKEVAIGWSDWAFVRLARFTPWALDVILRRYG